MSAGISSLAIAALMPAMVGPLPVEEARAALLLALCGGGEVEIALDADASGALPLATTPCCAKGCRGSAKRRVIDPRQ